MEFKVCTKCDKKLTIDHYHNKGNGLKRNDCKFCVTEYGKAYRNKNADSIKVKKKKYHKEKPYIKRRSHLKLTYGITLEEYAKLLKKQKGQCKICAKTKVGNSQHKHLHVDHCHKTGKIRGLLCARCNTAIGHMEDNVKLFKKAIKYLE